MAIRKILTAFGFFPFLCCRRSLEKVVQEILLVDEIRLNNASIDIVSADAGLTTYMKNPLDPSAFEQTPWLGLISSAEKVLGQGAFGLVTLHKLRKEACRGAPVVVKRIEIESQDDVAPISKEIYWLDQLKHPHIVRMYDWYPREIQVPGKMHLLLEAAMGGELQRNFNESAGYGSGDMGFILRRIAEAIGINSVSDQRKTNEVILFKMMIIDLLDGLAFMHTQDVVHRDIKPANIFAAKEASANCLSTLSCRFMLGDLGLIASLNWNGTARRAGTPYYMPPEVLQGGSWTKKGDVWALGASLLILFGDPRFYEGSRFQDHKPVSNYEIRENLIINNMIQNYIPTELQTLLVDMTEPQEEYRPDAKIAWERAWDTLTDQEKEGRMLSSAPEKGGALPCLQTCMESTCGRTPGAI